jgi:hypothetical protein
LLQGGIPIRKARSASLRQMLEKLEHVCQDVDAKDACYAKPCVNLLSRKY